MLNKLNKMGRTKKKEEIKNKTIKKNIKTIENNNVIPDKCNVVDNINEEDSLNVEQEQNNYEEKEASSDLNQTLQEESPKNLEIDNEQEEIGNKDIEASKSDNNIEIISEKKPKKPVITTNEMFGYNWMGQIYDF